MCKFNGVTETKRVNKIAKKKRKQMKLILDNS
jgi:hypothetical protein